MQVQIDPNGTVTQHGNVTRVSHGHPIQEVGDTPANASVRVGGTVHRIVNGLEVESTRVTRHQEGLPSQTNGSIMSTMRREGRSPSVELIPGNPASRTSLETAVRDGLVREVAPGLYVDALPTQLQPLPGDQQPQQGPQKGQEEAKTDAPFSWVNQNDMALWNEDVAPIGQHSYDSAVASVVALVGGGSGSLESIAERLAASEGMEPELAQQYVNEGVAFYKDSLSRDLVNTAGLQKTQVEPFYEWVKTKPELNRALSQLMHEGKTAEFRSLAIAYKRETASSGAVSSTFKAAGMETMVDRDSGELLVRMPGKSWVKAGDL